MSGFSLEERDPISDLAYRALLDWFMVSDPWPLEERERMMVMAFLNAEASKRGFETWAVAYHEFDPNE